MDSTEDSKLQDESPSDLTSPSHSTDHFNDSKFANLQTSPSHCKTSPLHSSSSPLSSPVHLTSPNIHQSMSPLNTSPNSSPTSGNISSGGVLTDSALLGKPKKKKSVTWAKESDLKSFFYFELDETERG